MSNFFISGYTTKLYQIWFFLAKHCKGNLHLQHLHMSQLPWSIPSNQDSQYGEVDKHLFNWKWDYLQRSFKPWFSQKSNLAKQFWIGNKFYRCPNMNSSIRLLQYHGCCQSMCNGLDQDNLWIACRNEIGAFAACQTVPHKSYISIHLQ